MTEEEEAQLAMCDRLSRLATFAVDVFVLDHRDVWPLLTQASQTRLIVQAALGFLIGEGLIEEKPQPEEGNYVHMRVPGHLAPAVPPFPSL